MSVVQRPPGGIWTSTLLDADPGDAASWTVALLDVDTDVVVVAAAVGAVEVDPPSGNYRFTFSPLPSTAGQYKAEWVNGAATYLDDDQVEVTYNARTVTGAGIAAPGSSQRSTLRGVPRDLIDSLTWRLLLEQDGTATITESSTGIVELDVGDDCLHRYDRVYTAPATEGRYREIWRWGTEEFVRVVVVAGGPEAAFATAEDVEARLGRDLTAQETASVAFLLPMAATVLADAAGKNDGWIATVTPVPQILRGLNVELVRRALVNPDGVQSYREQLGAHSYSATFAADRLGMELTKTEQLIVSRAVHGRTTGSAPVHSALTRHDASRPSQGIE